MGLGLDLLTLEIQRRPFFLRTALGVVRRQAPVARWDKSILVTGQAYVREVFSRPTDFLFGFGNGPKMKLGPFLFGMDASNQYFAEKAALHGAALSPQRFAQMGDLVSQRAVEFFSRLSVHERQVDLVSEFIEPVLVCAAADFYGVDPDRAGTSQWIDADAGRATFVQWIRKLGAVVGSSVPAPFGLEALANGIAPELAAFLRSEVRRNPPRDTVIGALLASPAALPSAEDVARCIGGLMLAGAAVTKAFTLALHELLLRRRELQRAREAALRNDTSTVVAYAWEALRFRPAFPVLTRYCPRPTTLAQGTPSETSIPADATLIVSPLAAMFDPNHVERPDEFMPTRPYRTYYHFGFGLHRCFGEQLAAQCVGAALTFLLAHLDIEAGRLEYDGPAVARYRVTCRPHPVPKEVSDETKRTYDHRPSRSARPRAA